MVYQSEDPKADAEISYKNKIKQRRKFALIEGKNIQKVKCRGTNI